MDSRSVFRSVSGLWMYRGRIWTLLLLTFFALPPSLPAGLNPYRNTARNDVVPGVLILKVRPGVSLPAGTLSKTASGLSARLARLNVTSVDQAFPGLSALSAQEIAAGKTDLSRVYRLSIPPADDPAAVARILSRDPSVEYAEPKYFQALRDTPNDPGLPNQNAVFTRMNAFNGWSIAKGAKSVAIANVDGGTYWQHEDILPNLHINPAEDINNNGRFDSGPPPAGDEDGLDQDGNLFTDDVIGWNFNLQSNNPNAPPSQPGNFFHGTATASHSSASTNNGIGMVGTSWNCSLMPICAAARSGDNLIEFGYEGIAYACRTGARVINCSWGRTGGFSRFEQEVINAATEAGALVVSAAGNDNLDSDYFPSYPANYKNVLAVGGTLSNSDAKASFSNYGVSVPVYAPADNIWSAFTNGGYGNGGSGTSYSSPLVAGLVGILMSQHPTWSPVQIAAQIRTTADSIDLIAENTQVAGKLGRGRVNFARALSESHPGIEIVSQNLLTPSGGELFLTGDTVRLVVTVKNVLFVAAQNVRFSCTPEPQQLEVLQNTATLSTLSPGQQVLLPDFVFRVRSLSTAATVVLKLSWSADGNYQDAAAFKMVAFPTYPDWLKQESPASVSLFSVKAVSANVGWAAGGNEVGTRPIVVRTKDAGRTWSEVTGNLSGRDLYCVDAVDSMHAWVGTNEGEIYATTNGGSSWSLQAYPSPASSFIDAIHFFDALNGFALGDPPAGSAKFVLLKTTNGGATWAHLSSEPTGTVGEAGWNNSFSWADPLHGWFGTNASRIWRTTDGGATWTYGSSTSPWSVGVSFGTPAQGLAVHTDGTIVRSDNGGQTWTRITSPTSEPFVAVTHAPGTIQAWGATTTMLFASTDNGGRWAAQSTYPFEGGATHLSFSDTARGWAVTRNGEILRFVSGSSRVGTLPETPVLEQNYPNPFNGTTAIQFYVPRESRVIIEVFSILGAKVATIFDDVCFPPRNYTARLDSRGLASGVYFYRLRAEDYVKVSTTFVTKKLVIVR